MTGSSAPGRCHERAPQTPRVPPQDRKGCDLERRLRTRADALRGWSRAGPLLEGPGLEDLFTCNRATTLLEMDRQDFDLARLKEIVLRSPGKPERRARGAMPPRTRTRCAGSTPRRLSTRRAPSRRAASSDSRSGPPPRSTCSRTWSSTRATSSRRGRSSRKPSTATSRRATRSRARPPSSPTTSATATSLSIRCPSACRSSIARCRYSRASARVRRWTIRASICASPP